MNSSAQPSSSQAIIMISLILTAQLRVHRLRCRLNADGLARQKKLQRGIMSLLKVKTTLKFVISSCQERQRIYLTYVLHHIVRGKEGRQRFNNGGSYNHIVLQNMIDGNSLWAPIQQVYSIVQVPCMAIIIPFSHVFVATLSSTSIDWCLCMKLSAALRVVTDCESHHKNT